MREGRASTTAIFVAWARGLGRDVHDALAPEVLPAPLALHVSANQRFPTAAAPLKWLARAPTFGLVDHIALRTMAIDAALRDAIDDGIDRLVILGAGLDSRAWRLPWLAAVDVMEVAHPATQALKREAAFDNKYTIFGKVIEGMNNVRTISGVQPKEGERPVEPVRIKTIRIEPKQ